MVIVFAVACAIVVLVSGAVFNRRMRALAEQTRKDLLEATEEPNIIERIAALDDPTGPLARRIRAYDFKVRLAESMMSFGVTMTEAAKRMSDLRK